MNILIRKPSIYYYKLVKFTIILRKKILFLCPLIYNNYTFVYKLQQTAFNYNIYK